MPQPVQDPKLETDRKIAELIRAMAELRTQLQDCQQRLIAAGF